MSVDVLMVLSNVVDNVSQRTEERAAITCSVLVFAAAISAVLLLVRAATECVVLKE